MGKSDVTVADCRLTMQGTDFQGLPIPRQDYKGLRLKRLELYVDLSEIELVVAWPGYDGEVAVTLGAASTRRLVAALRELEEA